MFGVSMGVLETPLLLYSLADLFDGAADLLLGLAKTVLDAAFCFVGDAFVVEGRVFERGASRLLDLTFDDLDLALNLISIHEVPAFLTHQRVDA